MRIITLLAVCALLSLGLFAQSQSLTGSCQTSGSYPTCSGGEVSFTGSGYSGQAYVKVVNSSGKTIDNGNYQLNGGQLTFTENLSIPDTYTVYVNNVLMLTVTTD